MVFLVTKTLNDFLFYIFVVADLVRGHPIICSKTMLEIMFNEPQLLIVYRVALEIELVYAPTPEQRDEFLRFTVDDAITILEGENPYNNGETSMFRAKKVTLQKQKCFIFETLGHSVL